MRLKDLKNNIYNFRYQSASVTSLILTFDKTKYTFLIFNETLRAEGKFSNSINAL